MHAGFPRQLLLPQLLLVLVLVLTVFNKLLPHIHSFGATASGSAVFSVVDLVRGYHQIPMAPECYILRLPTHKTFLTYIYYVAMNVRAHVSVA